MLNKYVAVAEEAAVMAGKVFLSLSLSPLRVCVYNMEIFAILYNMVAQIAQDLLQ